MPISRCTALHDSSGEFCDRPSMPEAPFPICPRHAVRLFEHMADHLTSARGDHLFMLSIGMDEIDGLRLKANSVRRPPEPSDPVVYYLLIDGLVKIGYATNITKRLSGYPPTAKLLATEPGDRSREAQRHREFNEYLSAGREWFTPGPRLRDHIEGLTDYRAA